MGLVAVNDQDKWILDDDNSVTLMRIIIFAEFNLLSDMDKTDNQM
jgi:hypothetical protein